VARDVLEFGDLAPYPLRGDGKRLYEVHCARELFRRHPNPLRRLGQAFDRSLGARSKGRNSKYHVAHWPCDRLEAAS
jgi:hypothetical protein